jgi:hypothetical protein
VLSIGERPPQDEEEDMQKPVLIYNHYNHNPAFSYNGGTTKDTLNSVPISRKNKFTSRHEKLIYQSRGSRSYMMPNSSELTKHKNKR